MLRLTGCIVPLFGLLVVAATCPLLASAPPPHYAIDVTVDYDLGSFAGILRVTYRNTTGTELPELFFRLYPNAAGIYGAASLRTTETLVDDRAVETLTFVDDTVLLVPLPDPLLPEAEVIVTIAFEGDTESWVAGTIPSAHSYGLLTRSERALTLTAFYPLLALYTEEGWALDPVLEFGDALMSEAATYEVQLTTRSDITPVTSGVLGGETRNSESTTYAYTLEGARDFSAVLVDGYAQQSVVIDEVTLRTTFLPQKSRAADITLALASDALTLFGDLIGPNPFGEVDLVEVPLQHAAGVEFSGLILVSSSYAEDPNAVFFDVIVSHEMAHQWFYAGVGNDVSEDPWLDESLATYLSYLFLDAYFGPNVAATALGQSQRTFDQARQNSPAVTISSPIYAFSQSTTYSAFIYHGGATFLHAVRQTIGEGPFIAALASYYAENLARIATPSDLVSAFETSCQCDLSDLQADFDLHP